MISFSDSLSDKHFIWSKGGCKEMGQCPLKCVLSVTVSSTIENPGHKSQTDDVLSLMRAFTRSTVLSNGPDPLWNLLAQ